MTTTSKWQQCYKVHPSTDVFPMMTAEELAELGADIKANRLQEQIKFYQDGDAKVVIDGRNRLEAMEQVGIDPSSDSFKEIDTGNGFDLAAYIISLNIHRRHLTKTQQADFIVAAIKAAEKKLDQVKPVSKGGRGKVNETKAKAVSEGNKLGISESTIKVSLAKAEGRAKPKAKSSNRPKWAQGDEAKAEDGTIINAASEPEPVSGRAICGDLTMARKVYLLRCKASPGLDLKAEAERITKALRGIAIKRAAASVH